VNDGHAYAVFGLIVESEFELSELEGARLDGAPLPDVSIAFGTMPVVDYDVDYQGVGLHVGGGDLYINVPGIAQFKLEDGNRIVVDPAPTAERETVRTYLFGTIMGALLYRRGILPLHANAIEVGGAVFAVAGPSGAGKSTLAYQLQDLGYRLLTDDICAVTTTTGGEFWAWRGIPRVKLWRDALEAFGETVGALRPLTVQPDKYALAPRLTSGAGPHRLLAIYALDDAVPGQPNSIRRLEGLDAVNVVTANSYRRRLAEVSGLGPQYLQQALRLSQSVPVYSVERVRGFQHLGSQALELVEHMKSLERTFSSGAPEAS
jgi:hypothetical protein